MQSRSKDSGTLRRRGRDTRAVSDMRGHSGKAAVIKAGRELLLEPGHAGTLILDFQPVEP